MVQCSSHFQASVCNKDYTLSSLKQLKAFLGTSKASADTKSP